MIKLKTIVLSILVLVLVVSATNAQLKIGVQGGANLSNLTQNFADSDEEDETKFKAGVKIGGVIQYDMNETFFLRAGLAFSSKGAGIDLEDGVPDGISIEGYDRLIINYLELPVSAGYSVGPINILGGFYAAMGLSGKNKYDVEVSGEFQGFPVSESEKGSDDIDFNTGEYDPDNDNAEINRYDFGINIGIEYELNPIIINFTYSKGFSNLSLNDPLDDEYDKADYKITNSVLGLSVIYFLPLDF